MIAKTRFMVKKAPIRTTIIKKMQEICLLPVSLKLYMRLTQDSNVRI